MLRELFERVLNEYQDASMQSGKKSEVFFVITKQLPETIKKSATISDKYNVYGRAGAGGWSEVPFVAVCDLAITDNTRNGYYIVYLFDSKAQGFYLSLAVGWDQFDKKYPAKIARQHLQQTAATLEACLRSDLPGFQFGSIDLHGRTSRAKGYEQGQICSKYYDASSIPNDIALIEDLQILIGAYSEIKGVAGNDIFNVKKIDLDKEERFQDEVNDAEPSHLPDGPLPIPKRGKSSRGTSWNRDRTIAHTALINAEYKCECEPAHHTFISGKTGKMFMEAHHLIPMEYQYQFSYSIDIPSNILCLCPNCHRKMHLAESVVRTEMFNQFYEKRIENLRSRGIEISFEELLSQYL